jgi:hypothetical protein
MAASLALAAAAAQQARKARAYKTPIRRHDADSAGRPCEDKHAPCPQTRRRSTPACTLQGNLLDLDGSLINNQPLPAALLLPAGSGGPSPGPGATLHSAIGNLLYSGADCVSYNSTDGTAVDTSGLPAIVPDGPASPADAMWCGPSLVFRQVRLSYVAPASTAPIYVVDVATNRSSLVPYTIGAKDGGGWQFNVAAQREYSWHLGGPNRTDVTTYR